MSRRFGVGALRPPEGAAVSAAAVSTSDGARPRRFRRPRGLGRGGFDVRGGSDRGLAGGGHVRRLDQLVGLWQPRLAGHLETTIAGGLRRHGLAASSCLLGVELGFLLGAACRPWGGRLALGGDEPALLDRIGDHPGEQ